MEHARRMRPIEERLLAFARGLLRPPPKQSPSDWAAGHVVFDERDYRGPFLLEGAEYLREPLDDFARRDIGDCVECWGSQSKKTGMLMAGAAWTAAHEPCGMLWVMPTRELARRFSKERLQPCMVKSVPELVPVGARRHRFSTFDLQLGSAGIYLIGSNSPASLSSSPCRLILLDEVDKFDEGTRGEADAVDLAEQRTKNALWPQKRKTSTPTLLDGLIWQEFLKGDQRRYFVPCPGCGKEVVFAWSKTYTVLKLTGAEAFVTWDKQARRKDGSWDLERVARSARAECPHCGFHVRDGHKAGMLKAGVWRATARKIESGKAGKRESGGGGLSRFPAFPLSRSPFTSRHLPSLYSTAAECGFGRLAVKFLEKKNSLLGLQGFINGDLAEPYVSQDTAAARVELISKRVEITAEWQKLLTIDCQHAAPYFWWVKRAWDGGNSEGIAAGSADNWEELRSVQAADGIPDARVLVDSGFGARSDADVYKACVRYSEMEALPNGRALAIGWLPSKGMPSRKRWKDPESDLLVPWFLSAVDPFSGTAQAGLVTLSLLEFSADFFKDVLAALRQSRGGFKWTVAESMATEEYWRQLDAEVKTAIFSRVTGRTHHQWLPRSKHWPNHLLDCETLQVAGASFFRFFTLEEPA